MHEYWGKASVEAITSCSQCQRVRISRVDSHFGNNYFTENLMHKPPPFVLACFSVNHVLFGYLKFQKKQP